MATTMRAVFITPYLRLNSAAVQPPDILHSLRQFGLDETAAGEWPPASSLIAALSLAMAAN